MQRIIILIYAIATAAVAGACAIFYTWPILFLIDIFATDNGEKYYIMPVFLIVWLILLTPLLIVVFIAWLARKKKDEIIAPERTGIYITRKKSFQSALVGIPIYLNDKKAGVVDNGRTRFFDLKPGMITIQVGTGKPASEKLQSNISEGTQLRFEMEIMQAGLGLKYSLKQV